jgi:hypothetical protein
VEGTAPQSLGQLVAFSPHCGTHLPSPHLPHATVVDDGVVMPPQSLGHDCAVSPHDLTHCPSPHLPHEAADATRSQPTEFEVSAKPKPPAKPEPMATTQIITARKDALRKFKVFSFFNEVRFKL